MQKSVDHMQSEITSFTQLYDLVGLSIQVILIVGLVYDVLIWLKTVNIQVCFWGVVGCNMRCGELKVLNVWNK